MLLFAFRHWVLRGIGFNIMIWKLLFSVEFSSLGFWTNFIKFHDYINLVQWQEKCLTFLLVHNGTHSWNCQATHEPGALLGTGSWTYTLYPLLLPLLFHPCISEPHSLEATFGSSAITRMILFSFCSQCLGVKGKSLIKLRAL